MASIRHAGDAIAHDLRSPLTRMRAKLEVALIDADEPLFGWSFGRGEEFPGAKGSLKAAEDVAAQRRPALALAADFTGGGNYVQMGRRIDPVDVDSLSLWVKAPKGADGFTLRLIDGTGQCHQLPLRIAPSGEWQRIVFPVLLIVGLVHGIFLVYYRNSASPDRALYQTDLSVAFQDSVCGRRGLFTADFCLHICLWRHQRHHPGCLFEGI